jgi:hypothetical protein
MPYVAYYGDRDEEQMDAPTKSYDRCHKFATATALGNNFKYTLAMTSARKSYPVVDLVRDLVLNTQDHVVLRIVYDDSKFCSVDSIRAFENMGVK